jgi:antitoxin component YwqK of YwqJK toxin-antitoxin module
MTRPEICIHQKMNCKLFLIALLLVPCVFFAQKDTIYINQSPNDFINRALHSSSTNYDYYGIDSKEVTKNEYDNLVLLKDSIDILLPNCYTIFTIGDKRIVEGTFYWGNFEKGFYKEYYANGNPKMEGYLNDYGNKIGSWKFYNENGKLKNTRKYRINLWYRYPKAINCNEWKE